MVGLRMPQARHIIDAMETPSNPGQTPALPVPGSEPVPLPISTFSTLQRPPPTRGWKPRCGHISMTRLYHTPFRCQNCQNRGVFGWLYRCTQDREVILRDMKSRGGRVTFDEIGEGFAEHMSLGNRGPDARSDKFSFLKEITSEEMQSYTPDQIATILGQRENVHEAIARDRRGGNTVLRDLAFSSVRQPWVPRQGEECQHKVCPSCNITGKDKSWLSLNGIANGVIPPTAVTGFSFSYMKSRPVSDPDIVKNLGYRAVPMPRPRQLISFTPPSSPSSTWSVMDIVDEHLGKVDNPSDDYQSSWWHPDSGVAAEQSSSNHTTTTGTENTSGRGKTRAGASKADNSVNMSPEPRNEDLFVRPPWTPPLTPTRGAGSGLAGSEKAIRSASYEDASDGRSPSSLKTNLPVRQKVSSSVIPFSGEGKGSSAGPVAHTDRNHPVAEHYVPYQPEEECDVGLFHPFNQGVFDAACREALPHPSTGEQHFFAEEVTAMEEAENEGGFFGKEPLDVPGGVALTEEAVESATADIAWLRLL
ncbi:hypothetical protein QBC33DRAFT_339582 [Phialemonium atrogriseum]|uniref:Uncharacterized protein n=1 Tax=Phialemonium atrogriseum TaxID=1093897 RepID=A0AAJ0C2P0_9PEZI|nr:uncharacterized protein QBC33DRAFT_339582 [Phialemonium atrogriseum]KAK1769055.1 hypothetical protein QBC33DRAFT_339582 [Phialemonium atrogriseum]